jgi:hypothetical protein
VYVKASSAVEDQQLIQAEEALGAAGLWTCAAEMHRVHGRHDDFVRVASAHAPNLLKAAVSSNALQKQLPSDSVSVPKHPGGDHSATGTRDTTANTEKKISVGSDPSSTQPSSTRISFPAPPSPLRSGLFRARFFIPGTFLN